MLATEQNLDERIDQWLAAWQKLVDEQYENPVHGHPTVKRDGGEKFLRITRFRTVDGKEIKDSVCAFVALSDGQNKKLGPWKAGDIFKPDGWKGPARTSRGNLFDEHKGMKFMSAYGPAYLR